MVKELKRRATMRDVAQLANLSHQTVSRYLRDEGGLKDETASRIRAAIEALDYHPNLVARSMRTRQTNRIAVVLPESTDWVPLQMLAAAARTAREHGYAIDVVGLGGDPARRMRDLGELVDSRQAAGILSLTPLEGYQGSASDTTIRGVPLVIAGSYDEQMRLRGGLADGSAIADVVTHLAGLGHRTFAHLAGPVAWESARHRSEVFHRTITDLGLTSVGTFVGEWSLRSGYDLAGQLRPDSGVTAIIAANDQIALGAMRRLQEDGWQIPHDVSVFGWNDDEFSGFVTPSLSTVAADLEGVGAYAMNQLLAALNGQEAQGIEPRLVTHLIVRESSGPAPR